MGANATLQRWTQRRTMVLQGSIGVWASMCKDVLTEPVYDCSLR